MTDVAQFKLGIPGGSLTAEVTVTADAAGALATEGVLTINGYHTPFVGADAQGLLCALVSTVLADADKK